MTDLPSQTERLENLRAIHRALAGVGEDGDLDLTMHDCAEGVAWAIAEIERLRLAIGEGDA